jgi:acetylornithine deacetylase/succinyl-diaminopimelate desuccinylase-like protein
MSTEPAEIATMHPHPPVVEICSRLLSIDSSNYGSAGGPGERAVADYVVSLLTAAGYEPTVLESRPGRTNVLLRVPGSDASLPGFLVHGHLDVVPAEREQWSVDPFGGVIADGYLWGRGATDMKDMVASMLSALLRWAETGSGPQRDVVFAFVADEEANGTLGAQWLVENHPQWFDGVVAGISEGGGIPIEAEDTDGERVRFYPVSSAERGTHHLALRVTGESGHGSRPAPNNAVTLLIDALGRVAHHRWPIELIASSRAYLETTTSALGIEADLLSDDGIEAALEAIGSELRGDVYPSSRCSVNPTVLRAGYKVNVIPGLAEAEIDVRSVPGTEDALLATIAELLGPNVSTEFISNEPGISAPFDSPWFRSIAETIRAQDPSAVVVPYCLGGGTDAKAFARLGIDCYGFSPLGLDPDGRTGSGMHGVDERVPVASLIAGAAMLEHFLSTV